MPLSVKELLGAPGVPAFLSFMFGIGVAAMFRPICKGPDCLVVRGPPVNDIRNAVYQFGNKCVEFKTKAMECPAKSGEVVDTVSFVDYSR
jgi:hypothetical protein